MFKSLPLLLLFCCSTAFAATTLVKNGTSDYVIVCDNASTQPSPEMRGATQLQSYIAQISGAKLPIVAPAETIPPHAIIVGINQCTNQLGIKLDIATLGDDGFITKTLGDRIILAGPGKRGTMYACFDLLEKMGVRWFTSSITRIPHQSDLTLPNFDQTQIPSFEYREPFYTEAIEPDWCAHLRCNSNKAPLDASYGGNIKYAHFVHTLHEIIPPSQFAAHPEYFSLVNGKRVNNAQLCLSNPDVLKIAIDTVNQWIDQNPDAKIFSVSQNDTDGFCTCDECKKLMKQYGGPSGEYIWFVNQVAAAIAIKHPDVLIDTLAYQFTEAPPTNIKPLPNVRVRLCPIGCDEAHPYEQSTAPANKLFVEHLKGWAKLTDNLYIWHYGTDFANYLMPFPDFDQFTNSFRLYKRSGVKGIFIEGDRDPGGGGSDSELRAYVMGHLLWNCDADENQLIDDWMTGVYGPGAAKPMRQWFDLLQSQVSKPDVHLFIYDNPSPKIFSPEVMATGDQLLTQATTLDAANPVALKYINKARLDWRYVDLMLHPTDGEKLQQFLSDVRAAGIHDLNEMRPIEKWLISYEKRVKKAQAATAPAPS